MNKRSAFVLVLAMSTGCVAGSEEATSQTAAPVLTANALTPSALANGALATAQLDATSAAAMAANADARAVLGYAVDCALDATQSVSFTVGGASYTQGGGLGLAPAWTTRALTSDEAAWISACVFSRVNLTGTSVAISARGTSSVLGSTASERATYVLEEGAFWGNAFGDVGEIEAFACNGVDQAADDSVGDLPQRACAQPSATDGSTTPCGMYYAGRCDEVCTSSGPYAGCAAPGGAAATAVITTLVSDAQ